MHAADNIMFFYIVALAILIAASVEDYLRKEVSVLMPVLCGINSASSVVLSVVSGEFDMADTFAAFLPGVVLILVAVATRQSVGYGDGLMTLSFSPALGLWNTCMGLIVAMVLSAVASILILVLKKGDRNTKLPFVPFITLGVGVTILAQI